MPERIVFELTSADIPGALGIIREANIPVDNIIPHGPVTVRFFANRTHGPRLCSLLERRGDRVVMLQRLGFSQRAMRWLRHPLLLTAAVVMLWLTAWLPTKVLFVQVQGNSSLPTGLILARAEECGICFGAERSEVRSEKIKNALMESVPGLQWTGINTAGCVATILVRERTGESEEERLAASGIVALRDGVIRSCHVEKGTLLCRPGQAVRAGEILVSGLTDCGRAILVSGAEGEIQAETSRSLFVRTVDSGLLRSDREDIYKKFSLLIGKKRINFYNDSGILDGTCVKMYSEYYMTLPGGFRLPLGIGVETTECYAAEVSAVEDASQLMERSAKEYLLTHMTAGEILEEKIASEGNKLYADYICLEMIGQNQYEEYTRQDGKNDGENG